MMKLSDFDYQLPEFLIAQHPSKKRDESRLLVYHRGLKSIEHRIFKDVLEYMHRGDCLVINDTKVIPARLLGFREDTGGKLEMVLLNQRESDIWEVLVKPGKKARVGTIFVFGEGLLRAEILDKTKEGGRLVRLYYQGVFEEVLDKVGIMPLPPYIHETLGDRQRYQTVYAQYRGSAAAPTAGLHFTPELLRSIENKGVDIAKVTLHVGLGTFRPVKTQNITEHTMHTEAYHVSPQAANIINTAKLHGARIIAVGTTSVRTLEASSDQEGMVRPGHGRTNIFIYPGYRFKVIDALITNFHLPKSTLLMLVSAFAGREEMIRVYNEAIKKEYRFFSFGDAMIIL